MSTLKPISYEGIIKLLRQTIIDNTGLAPSKVLNALSARGTDLSELIAESKTYSYDLASTFILFELLREPEAEDNYVTPDGDDKMLVITSYIFHMIAYGNGSDLLAQKLRATFKNPSIAESLRDDGIFVKSIGPGTTVHEFVNNSMLLRVDIDLSFVSCLRVDNAFEQEYFSTTGFLGENAGLVVKSTDEV